MNSNLPEFTKNKRCSFYVSRMSTDSKLVNQKEAECSFEDELPENVQEIITRMILPDAKPYEQHINKLKKEEETIKAEYLRMKSEYELANKLDEKVTFISSTDCDQYLTEQDKQFLQLKPDYSETVSQMNKLMNEITLLMHNKCAKLKPIRNNHTLVMTRLRNLKKAIIDLIVRNDELGGNLFEMEEELSSSSSSSSSEEEEDDYVMEEALKFER